MAELCFACSTPAEEEVLDTDKVVKPVCGMHQSMVLKQGGTAIEGGKV